jgi:hypothetical protein
VRPDELASHLDNMQRRLTALETHALGIPFSAPATGQTLVVDAGIAARDAAYPGLPTPGLITLRSGAFTIVGAGASYILEGAIDARMLRWDNFVGAPRREGWVDISGLVASAHSEWPFGITRVTRSFRVPSSGSTAIAAGAYTARALFQQAGNNDVQIFGGYLRVTIIQ